MEDYGLARQKLFTLQRRTLEKRLHAFYYQTHDEKTTIEMLIALQVRDELTGDAFDFSRMLTSVVYRIFLRTRTTKIMRRFYLYFIDYSSGKDWQLLTAKLFPVLTYNEEDPEVVKAQMCEEEIIGCAES